MSNKWSVTNAIGETRYAGKNGVVPKSVEPVRVDYIDNDDFSIGFDVLYESECFYFQENVYENEDKPLLRTKCISLDETDSISVVWSFDQDLPEYCCWIAIKNDFLIIDGAVLNKKTGAIILNLYSEENLVRFQRGSVTGYIFVDDSDYAYFDCNSAENDHYCININNQETYTVVKRNLPISIDSCKNSYRIKKNNSIKLISLSNDSFEEVWKKSIELLQEKKPLSSSFCMVDNYIFYTDHQFLYRLDSQTGNQLNKWNYIEKVQVFDIPKVNVRACMSVASNGSELVLTSSGLFGLIVVMDYECNIHWVKATPRLGDIALAGDLLFTSIDHYHTGFNVKTGEQVWQAKDQSLCDRVMYGEDTVAYSGLNYGIEFYR